MVLQSLPQNQRSLTDFQITCNNQISCKTSRFKWWQRTGQEWVWQVLEVNQPVEPTDQQLQRDHRQSGWRDRQTGIHRLVQVNRVERYSQGSYYIQEFRYRCVRQDRVLRVHLGVHFLDIEA